MSIINIHRNAIVEPSQLFESSRFLSLCPSHGLFNIPTTNLFSFKQAAV